MCDPGHCAYLLRVSAVSAIRTLAAKLPTLSDLPFVWQIAIRAVPPIPFLVQSLDNMGGGNVFFDSISL